MTIGIIGSVAVARGYNALASHRQESKARGSASVGAGTAAGSSSGLTKGPESDPFLTEVSIYNAVSFIPARALFRAFSLCVDVHSALLFILDRTPPSSLCIAVEKRPACVFFLSGFSTGPLPVATGLALFISPTLSLCSCMYCSQSRFCCNNSLSYSLTR